MTSDVGTYVLNEIMNAKKYFTYRALIYYMQITVLFTVLFGMYIVCIINNIVVIF